MLSFSKIILEQYDNLGTSGSTATKMAAIIAPPPSTISHHNITTLPESNDERQHQYHQGRRLPNFEESCAPRKRQRTDSGPRRSIFNSGRSSTSGSDSGVELDGLEAQEPGSSTQQQHMEQQQRSTGKPLSPGQVESVKKDVAPFLSKYIPDQYSSVPPTDAQEQRPSGGGPGRSQANTKFCYRHRPDVKCRRQVADEKAMEELQKVQPALPSFFLFFFPLLPRTTLQGALPVGIQEGGREKD